MRKHEENAQAVAEFLEAHPKVSKVSYPGLTSDPGHKIAKEQIRNKKKSVKAIINCLLCREADNKIFLIVVKIMFVYLSSMRHSIFF